MTVSRRGFILTGVSSLVALWSLHFGINYARDRSRRAFYSVFEDVENRVFVLSVDPSVREEYFRLAQLPYKPHSMFSMGSHIVGVEKNGTGATILRNDDGQVALHFQPPDSSLWFYGHGIAHRFDPRRFYVSAYRYAAGYYEMDATSGMLLEYQLDVGKSGDVSASFVQSHETDGYVPHHMQYSRDGRYLHYTVKNDSRGQSRLVTAFARPGFVAEIFSEAKAGCASVCSATL